MPNRGLSGFPAGRGLQLGSLGDVAPSTAGVLDLKKYGEQPTFSPRTAGYRTSRGPRFDPMLSLYNGDASAFVNWHRAVGAARAGAANAVLCVIGDSTSTGRGDDVNKHANSWPMCLDRMMASRFMPRSYEALWGTHFGDNGEGLTSYDPRATLGSGWNNAGIMGGGGFQATAGGSGALTFTPELPFDRVRVWSLVNAANFGTLVVKVDGSSVGTTTLRTSGISVATDTFNTTLGTHTITLDGATGGAANRIDIAGIDVWDSTQVGLRTFMHSRGGAKVASYYPVPLFDIRADMAPALTIINLTLNDVETSGETPLGEYRRTYQGIIDTARLTGDVLMMTGNWAGGSSAGYGRSEPLHRAMFEVAEDNGVPLLDLRHRWPSYTKQNAVGSGGVPQLGGGLHPFAAGYQDIAAAVYNVITR